MMSKHTKETEMKAEQKVEAAMKRHNAWVVKNFWRFTTKKAVR